MKIGILTLPLHTNYGGILQAYALQTVLDRMGHEVHVINLDRTPRLYSTTSVIKHFIIMVLSSIKRHKIYKFYDIRKEDRKRYRDYLIKSKYTQQFIEKYIHNYWVQNYISDIVSADFDAIVVGSDQIWSPIHARAIGGVTNAFLPFLTCNKVRRISYAASFGKDIWKYSHQDTIIAKQAIKGFTSVSVRESSGIKLCKDYLEVEATQQIDPTLLLEASDYKSLLKLETVEKSNGNMLVYLIDSSSEKDAIVDYIENILFMHRFVVNSRAEDYNNKNLKIEDCIQPPVENWLRGFMDADFVVTDSFHACAFSIIFKKQFVVIGNAERGLTRFQSLMTMLDINNRIVSSLQEVMKLDLADIIDYNKVDRIIHEQRLKSMCYLKEKLA